MLVKMRIAAHYYLLVAAIYCACRHYMLTLSSCVWVCSGVEI